MLSSIPFSILVGIAMGFLAGLGVGGGSLLILWLTMVLHMDPQTARGINLLFFIPAALTVSIFRWRNACFNWSVVIPAALAGCATAILTSWISTVIDVAVLKKVFGILLIVTGLRELLYRPRNAR